MRIQISLTLFAPPLSPFSVQNEYSLLSRNPYWVGYALSLTHIHTYTHPDWIGKFHTTISNLHHISCHVILVICREAQEISREIGERKPKKKKKFSSPNRL